MHVLGVEDGCAGTDGGFNDEGVPVADVALLDALEGELDEGGVDRENVASRQSFNDPANLVELKRRVPLPGCDGDELIENLSAEDQFVGTDESFDKLVGDGYFGGNASAGGREGIKENVGVYERGHCVRSA